METKLRNLLIRDKFLEFLESLTEKDICTEKLSLVEYYILHNLNVQKVKVIENSIYLTVNCEKSAYVFNNLDWLIKYDEVLSFQTYNIYNSLTAKYFYSFEDSTVKDSINILRRLV